MREIDSADRHSCIPSRERTREKTREKTSDAEKEQDIGKGWERGGKIGMKDLRVRSPELTAQPPRGSGRNPTPLPITYPPS
jgi:hypothetical protein